MIRIMDHLWRNEGLDLHMQPYRAVSTGMEEGLIEVITNSETTSRIAFLYGGGVAGAFSRTALKDWLLSVNSTELAQRSAINNLTLSCAGYCVATYILGIGDRHNDNIMVTYQGNLFHIDFAYFLGRRVTFAGIQRETAPFVLTPRYCGSHGWSWLAELPILQGTLLSGLQYHPQARQPLHHPLCHDAFEWHLAVAQH